MKFYFSDFFFCYSVKFVSQINDNDNENCDDGNDNGNDDKDGKGQKCDNGCNSFLRILEFYQPLPERHPRVCFPSLLAWCRGSCCRAPGFPGAPLRGGGQGVWLYLCLFFLSSFFLFLVCFINAQALV